MKKIILIACLTLIFAACAPAEGPYKNGTYTGTGNGYGGEIKVSVVIEKGNIKEVIIDSHTETPGISAGAFETVIADIIKKNTAEGIDVNSSASFTSNAIIQAVATALEKAK
jgi:fumarate reductase flavoprotein subunit